MQIRGIDSKHIGLSCTYTYMSLDTVHNIWTLNMAFTVENVGNTLIFIEESEILVQKQ